MSAVSANTARRGFRPLRDIPAVVWLLAVVVVALLRPALPAPRWLMLHLLLLGAVTHSILVWSQHFTDGLLHTVAEDRRQQSRRLLILNVGVTLIVVGVPGGWWALTVTGAAAVGAAVLWHGASLARQLRGTLSARFGTTVRYYIAAAALLPIGAGLGATLGRQDAEPLHTRLLVAHVVLNLLGWIGLTVIGTLVTLWPTMLRTRIADGAELAARRGLSVLVTAVVAAASGAVAGLRAVVVLGLVAYLLGLAVVARSFAREARTKPPASYATWSVLAALLWLVGGLTALTLDVGGAGSWATVNERFDGLVPLLVAGFGAQVLLGALSYLVPVVLGGGPGPVRAANAVLDKVKALRIGLANGGLVIATLPVPSIVRDSGAYAVLVALGSFLPLLLLAMRASRKASATPRPTRADSAGCRRVADSARRCGPNPVNAPDGQSRQAAG